jgi:RNA-directed DNA polymerase
MNAEHVACASSAAVEHWDQIDWKRCEQRVARLQARIVKASREDRWGKVKALQRLLTCSFSGKALAVKRVTENKYSGPRRSPNSKRSHRYSAGDTTRCRYGGCIFQNPTAS